MTRKREQPPWEHSAPAKAHSTKLNASDKAKAKRRATRAGRPYPNLVDNMAVAKEKRKKS